MSPSTWRTPVILPAQLARDGEIALTQLLNQTDRERFGYYNRGYGWAGRTMESLRVALRPAWSHDADEFEPLDTWRVARVGETAMLMRSFAFESFTLVRAFAADVAAVADRPGLNPQILMECGSVTVWLTPAASGMEDPAVCLARDLDSLYEANCRRA